MWLKIALKYWTQGLSALAAAILVWNVSGHFHEREINRITIEHNKEIKKTQISEREDCANKQNLTKEVGDELTEGLKSNIAQRDAIIDRLRREGTACRAVAYSAFHPDGATETGSLPSRVGQDSIGVIDAESVTRLFYEADNNTEKLLACQSFISKVYELNKIPLDKSK